MDLIPSCRLTCRISRTLIILILSSLNIINAQSLNLVQSVFGSKSAASSTPHKDVIVTMSQTHDDFLQSFVLRSYASQSEKQGALANSLRIQSAQSQAAAMEVIKAYNVKATSMWISNQIFIEKAPKTLVETLAQLPLVHSVTESLQLPIPPIFNVSIGQVPQGPEWNVRKIGATRLWNVTKGEGIIVGGIDTGVRGSHTALKENFIGVDNSGWFDPFLQVPMPEDINGHGTHTMGTICGKGGIGVAPAVKWMACRGCLLDSCMQHALLACGQFMLCPGQISTKDGRMECGTVPHIINNSWGGGGGQTWYEPVIKAWRAIGIIPFFAMGNSGPSCETLGSPGENEMVIAVGSTDKEDQLSKFSSRGPKVKVQEKSKSSVMGLADTSGITQKKIKLNVTKPEFCAPGEGVNSAFMASDSAYKILSGTSMATPAAAGAAALLLSINQDLTYDAILDLFTTTASRKVKKVPQGQCGPIPDNVFPNMMYGHGRINVYKAYLKLTKKNQDANTSKEADDAEDAGEERTEASESESEKGSKKDD